MTAYSVEYTTRAIRSLKRMDAHNSRIIYDWIEKNLVGCEDPRRHGKSLAGDLSGKWRYRIGDYRLIAHIEYERVVILIVDIDHRSKVYNVNIK